jgi:hypothetical protein
MRSLGDAVYQKYARILRKVAPFRALPFVFVARPIPDVVQAWVRQRMPVVCQCRRIPASPDAYGIREKRLSMQVIGPARSRLDRLFLTRNEQVSGSSTLVGSPFYHDLQGNLGCTVRNRWPSASLLMPTYCHPKLG